MCLSLASQEVSGTKQQAKGRRQCVTLKHSEPTEGSDAACIKTDRTYSIGMLSEAYAAQLLFQKGKILQYCIVILVKTIFSLKKKDKMPCFCMWDPGHIKGYPTQYPTGYRPVPAFQLFVVGIWFLFA